MPTTDTRPCPCGSERYAECCEPLHDGARAAETAEELMRSRYSAYARRDPNYVFRTWHPRTRPATIDEDGPTFTGLEILSTSDGGADDEEGLVEFRAHFTDRGLPGELHELSHFVRRGRNWVYLDAHPIR